MELINLCTIMFGDSCNQLDRYMDIVQPNVMKQVMANTGVYTQD